MEEIAMIPGAPLTLRHRQVQTDRMYTTPDFPTPVPLALTSAVCVHVQVTDRGWFSWLVQTYRLDPALQQRGCLQVSSGWG
jgi:hypothetical protein